MPDEKKTAPDAKADSKSDAATKDAAVKADEFEEPVPDGHQRITLVRPCRYVDDKQHTVLLPNGTHILPDSVANNWFVLYHSDNPPPLPPPQPGTPAYIAQKAAEASRNKLIQAAMDQEAANAVRASQQKRR